MIQKRESQASVSKNESSIVRRTVSMNQAPIAPSLSLGKTISVDESERLMQKAEGAVLYHCR